MNINSNMLFSSYKWDDVEKQSFNVQGLEPSVKIEKIQVVKIEKFKLIIQQNFKTTLNQNNYSIILHFTHYIFVIKIQRRKTFKCLCV